MSVIIDDTYTLIRDLGEGAFCSVYEARDKVGGVFALKLWK